MQIKLISFSENEFVSMNVAHEAILSKIKEITGIDKNFLFCQTQKEMFREVKEGIERADIILVAVDVSKFISTKAALIRALGLKCKLDAEILNLINSDTCIATLNENQTKAHAAIPVKGVSFITKDGLFSGFGVEAGKQKLIVVPIDERRIGSVLENDFDRFLAAGVKKQEAPVVEEAVKDDIPEEMEGYVQPIENYTAPAEAIEPQYEEIYRAPQASSPADEESYEDIQSSSYNEEDMEEQLPESSSSEVASVSSHDPLAALASRGVKIAFVRQTENAVYTNILADYVNSEAADFVDFSLDKTHADDVSKKEGIAASARAAIKRTDADYAIAMSEICRNEDGESYIFATLTDVNKSSVFKIFSSEDESDSELYSIGLESMIEKITKSTECLDSENDSFDSMGDAIPENKSKFTPSTQIAIWVLVIVALCALSALIIDFAMSSNASLSESSGVIIKEIGNILPR
ncbi:MAG: hypothetical protein IKL16_07115 [Clostridia bacterium]|nr:hypothetical protein [Clostridia bacterium]